MILGLALERQTSMIEHVEKNENQPNLNRPVSVWVIRHFTPAPGYPEENPLTETAPEEAKRASGEILSQVKDREILVIYGADVKGRHQETRRLLESELEKQIEENGRNIDLIKLPPTSYKRESLRGPGFSKEYVGRAGGIQKLLPYWMTGEDTFEGQVQRPEEVGRRLRSLIRGLTSCTRRSPSFGQKVHVVLITSNEVPTPEMAKKFGNKGLGLDPSRWVRFDVGPGEKFDRVRITRWDGISAISDLSKSGDIAIKPSS